MYELEPIIPISMKYPTRLIALPELAVHFGLKPGQMKRWMDKVGFPQPDFLAGGIQRWSSRLVIRWQRQFMPKLESENVFTERPVWAVAKRKMHTYFIQASKGGPVKIGRASCVSQRLRDLQCSHSDELHIIGIIDEDREKELHERFAAIRLKGEWFDNTEELVVFMRSECRGVRRED